MSAMVELIYRELKDELATMRVQVEKAQRTERAEIADSIPAYELADAPLAADGGLGDGTAYITLAWISDGRKSGEGAGAGTGILAFYDSATNTWKGVRSEVNVTV